MPTWLEQLRVDRVDFVDAGADPDAHVVIFKREGAVEHPDIAAPEELAKHLPDHDIDGGDARDHGAAHLEGRFAKGKAHTHTVEPYLGDEAYVAKKDYSTATRIALAKQGKAIPVKDADGNIVGGRFPIQDRGDLADAISSAGRSSTGGGVPDEVKRHIMKMARSLGAADQIPDSWTSGASKADGATLANPNTMTPSQMIQHLHTRHGVEVPEDANPFTVHDQAHAAGKYAPDQEHSHLAKSESWIAKVGRKLKGSRRKALEDARDALTRVLDEAREAERDEPAPVGKKGGRMPDDVIGALIADADTPEDVKTALTALTEKAGKVDDLTKRVGELEQEVEKGKGTEDEDVFKGLDPRAAELLRSEISKREASDARLASLEESTTVASFVAKAAELKHLPINAAEFGPVLMRVSKSLGDDEAGKAAFAEIERVLKAGDEGLAQERILRETTGAVFSTDSAYGKLEALAKARVEAVIKNADGSALTFEQAFAEVTQDPANSALVATYYDERKGANR